jgi:hypothetical protein
MKVAIEPFFLFFEVGLQVAGGPGLDFETWVVLVVETEPRRFQKDYYPRGSLKCRHGCGGGNRIRG